MPQFFLGVWHLTGLLEVFHALGNVHRHPQAIAVHLPQKIKRGVAVPVYLIQVGKSLCVVLLGALAVGVAGPQIVKHGRTAVVLRPLQKLKGLGVVPLHATPVIVAHAQSVGRVYFFLDRRRECLLIILGGPGVVLGHPISQFVGVTRPEEGSGLPRLRRPAVEVKGLPLVFLVIELVAIVEEVTGIPLLRPIAVHLDGFFRTGRDEPFFSLPVEISQVDAAAGEAAAQGPPQPVLALGIILPQIALDGVVAVKILPGLALNFREIAPVVGIADDHLTQRLPVLRLVQHSIKGLLKTQGHGLGQLPIHHSAAQGQQRSNSAALQHGAAHKLISRLFVHREIVPRPGILRPVQAPGQQTAGVRVSVLHRLLEQLKAFLAPPGAQVVVDVLECLLHQVTEKSPHRYVLLPSRQVRSVYPTVSSKFFLASGLFWRIAPTVWQFSSSGHLPPAVMHQGQSR